MNSAEWFRKILTRMTLADALLVSDPDAAAAAAGVVLPGVGNFGRCMSALRASGLDRADVFITTKCWNDDQGYEQAKRACRASLERLELRHLHLYLIHWPVPAHDRYG